MFEVPAADLVSSLNHAACRDRHVVARLQAVRAAIAGYLCLTTSFGIEDQLLAACIMEVDGDIGLATLDTGRLFAETHAVWRQTEQFLGRKVAVFSPAPENLAALVARDGADGFYQSQAQRRACCTVRKTEPLTRALSSAAAWITGLRAEQSTDRAGVSFAEWDAGRGLVKINPLYDWTRDGVLAELAARGLPVSALEARGYRSVGCAPCTRPLKPGEPERAGRWWWEDAATAKECGLHVAAT